MAFGFSERVTLAKSSRTTPCKSSIARRLLQLDAYPRTLAHAVCLQDLWKGPNGEYVALTKVEAVPWGNLKGAGARERGRVREHRL